MFREIAVTKTKLRARKLLHKKITDFNDLREIYEIGDVLGKGNFGTVVKAEHKETKVHWAIKIINKRQAGASRVLSVEREIYILKLVKHPNIIFLDCVFESPKTIYLVFELCIESLAKVLRVKKQFKESETINVIQSLSSALAYLHKNDIVHRDLKLENILTTYNPDDFADHLFIKVTDFGLSTMRTGHGYDNMFHDFCGTLAYMAPEMIATKSYSQQCDVWSMGIIMYVLLCGKFPFSSTNDQQLCKLISKGDIDFSGLPCSSKASYLLSKLLEKNPAFRLTAAEVENHPWISGEGTNLQTESSNVLDMMRLWRDEILESSNETISASTLSINNKQRLIQNPNIEKSNQQKEMKTKSLIEAENAVSSHTAKTEGEALNNNTNGENSELKNPAPRQSGNKQYEKAPSRLPDFSHIPAKVDSNLGNLRKEAQRRRRSSRKLSD